MKKIILVLCCMMPFISQGMNTPVLSSPNNGVTINAFNVFLYVGQVTGATGYQFQVDTLASFNSPWRKQDSSSFNYSYTPELKTGKTYYWRARAYKSGDTSTWSTSRSFIVGTPFLSLNSPANLSSGNIRALVCNNMGSNPNIGYQFEADTTAALNSPLKVSKTYFQNTQFVDSTLFDFGRIIFWRARSFNSLGDTTAWSSVWRYTTNSYPEIGGSSNLFITDPLHYVNWPTANLCQIELWADSSSSFNTPGLYQKLIPAGKINDSIYDLDFGKYYFYKIRLVFAGKYSGFSVVRMVKVYDNGFINGPSYAGQIIYGLNVAITARQLDGAQKRMSIYTDSLYTNLLVDTLISSQLTGFNYNGTLNLNTKYYVRVQYFHSKDTAAPLFSWFKTYTGQVNMGAPAANASKVMVRPRFSFRKYTWTNNYVMEIDTGIVFTPNHSSFFIRVDSFKYDGSYYHFIDTSIAYAKRYVWRVYAILGSDTAEATVRTFTSADAPINYYPPNNFIGTGPSTGGLITGINGSTHVLWQLDTSILFNSNWLLSGKDTFVPDDFTPQYVALNFPQDLKFSTKYYWRARCMNKIDTSLWSMPFNFITTQNPWLTAPANGAVNLGTSVKLEWGIQGSANEMRYQYQIGTDSMFTAIPIVTLPVASSANTTINLNYATKYYWRARAYHTKDTSQWSVIWNFTTQNAPVVSIPALYLPANGATNLPLTNIELSWSLVSNALTYDVQISNTADFAVILTSGNTSGNAILFNGAQAKSRYYWRVRGRNNNIVGLWSVVRWFETMPPTGVERLESTLNFALNPNPAKQTATIKCAGVFEVNVIDQQGKVVFGSNQNLDKLELETSTWENGIYTICVRQEDKVRCEKLIVIHE